MVAGIGWGGLGIGTVSVGFHLLHQLPNHLFQFVYKLLGIIFVCLYFAQFFLPLSGQFGTF
jgi:hypothetical protein